jgi:eukaryotic-like serine/threonine-protein kinase
MGAENKNQTATTLPAGTRLGEDGRYEVRELIGKGGMGHVYRVRDRKFDKSPNPRYLAMKMLAAAGSDASILQRFLNEAQATSGIEHDHIVPVLDYGVDQERGQPFFVMPLLQGQEFTTYLKEKAPLEIQHAVDIIVCICAGVSKCHAVGIIHRDLKPSNIFLAQTPSGMVPKLLDFGVSKYGNEELTNDGQLIGTFRYFSPEQAAGKKADARSDQYALALLLYAALTRNVPFYELTGISLLEAIKQGSIPSARQRRPEIPEELDAAIMRALSVDPAKRFRTVHEFARELVQFSTPNGIARAMWSNHFTKPPEEFAVPQFSGPVRSPSPASGHVVVPLRTPDSAPLRATPSRAPTKLAGYEDQTRAESARPELPAPGTTTQRDNPLMAETPPIPPMIAPAPSEPLSVGSDQAVPSSPSTPPVSLTPEPSGARAVRTRRVLFAAAAAAGLGAVLATFLLTSRTPAPPAVAPATTPAAATPEPAAPARPSAQEPPPAQAHPVAVPAPTKPVPSAEPARPDAPAAPNVASPAASAPATVDRAAQQAGSQKDATKPKRRPKRQKTVEYTEDGSPILQ